MRSIVLAMAILCAFFSSAEARRSHGGLPWCGIYMNQYFGKSDRSLWIARNWAREGSNAGGPSVGVVVVWPHHVGIIVGRDGSGEWLVHSGNDGNAIRTRPRSLRGAIAFRSVGPSSAYANLKWQEQAVGRRNKNLVALAVEGRPPAAHTAVTALKKSRAAADVASEPFSIGGYASAFAPPTYRAREVVGKKRKTVVERESVLVPLFATVPEPVHSSHRKKFSIHSSPHIQHDQAGADRPSSRASLRSASHTPHASPSSDSGGRGRGGGAGAGWREYQPDLI